MHFLIDTDAGVDDAQALLLALSHPAARVEAITTMTGNLHVDQVLRNVATTLKALGREDIPLYRGADRPLIAPCQHQTAAIHGKDGLGDWANRPVSRKQPETEHAALALIRLSAQYSGELTLLALGPMTNIALAIRLDPDFPSRIKQLIWMGGAVSGFGNTEIFTAEFNVQTDPEAAYITLEAFPNSIMIPWETSVRHAIPWDRMNALIEMAERSTQPIAQFFLGISRFTIAAARSAPELHGVIMPDPITVAVALDPGLVTSTQHRFVGIELGGTFTRGMTAVDFSFGSTLPRNTHIVTGINQDSFEDLWVLLFTKGRL